MLFRNIANRMRSYRVITEIFALGTGVHGGCGGQALYKALL